MAQAPHLALPLLSITLIPIASGVCQRGVFRKSSSERMRRSRALCR
jgi:hypothetical protein